MAGRRGRASSQVTRSKRGFCGPDLQVTPGGRNQPSTGSIPVRLRHLRTRIRPQAWPQRRTARCACSTTSAADRAPRQYRPAVLVHLPRAHYQPLMHLVAQSRLVDRRGALPVMQQLGGIGRAPPTVFAPDPVQHHCVSVQTADPRPGSCDGRTPQPPARPSPPARAEPRPPGMAVRQARPVRTGAEHRLVVRW